MPAKGVAVLMMPDVTLGIRMCKRMESARNTYESGPFVPPATTRPTIIRYVDKGVTAAAESIDCCKATGKGSPSIEHESHPPISASGLHTASNCLPGLSTTPQILERDDTGHGRDIECRNRHLTTEELRMQEYAAQGAYVETPGDNGVPVPLPSRDSGQTQWTLERTPVEDHRLGETAERTANASYVSMPKCSTAMQRIPFPQNQHTQYPSVANQTESSLPAGLITGITSVHISVPDRRQCNPRIESANATDRTLISAKDLIRPTEAWFPQDATRRYTEQLHFPLSRETSLSGSGNMHASARKDTDDGISRLDREALHEHLLQSQQSLSVSDEMATADYSGLFPEGFLHDRFPGKGIQGAEADNPSAGETDRRPMLASQSALEISTDAVLQRHGLDQWSSLATDDRSLRMATFWRPNPFI